MSTIAHELVADEDGQHIEETLRFGLREHRRGFVEDDEPRVVAQALDDLDALPFARREIADPRVRIDLQPVLLPQLL